MERTEAHPRERELQAFLDAHYQRVVGSVTMITGDRAGAEDAVQNAIVKAWTRRDEHVDHLAAWITVVASNEARSGHRRSASERRAVERLATRESGVHHDPMPTDQALADALAGLPDRERQAAVLFYVFDLGVADVANAMGVAEGTVKTLLSRARTHLAERLDHEHGGAS